MYRTSKPKHKSTHGEMFLTIDLGIVFTSIRAWERIPACRSLAEQAKTLQHVCAQLDRLCNVLPATGGASGDGAVEKDVRKGEEVNVMQKGDGIQTESVPLSEKLLTVCMIQRLV